MMTSKQGGNAGFGFCAENYNVFNKIKLRALLKLFFISFELSLPSLFLLRTCYVSQVVPLNSKSPCLGIWDAQITGICSLAQLPLP